MSVTETLATEFRRLAADHLLELGMPVNPSNVRALITGWLAIYEDVPPRTTAEKAVADALDRALTDLDRLLAHANAQN